MSSVFKSSLLEDMALSYVGERYPATSVNDRVNAARAFAAQARIELEDGLRKEIKQEVNEESAKKQVKEIGEKTRALLLEGVLLAISLDLFVSHVYALLDVALYGNGAKVNMWLLIIGLVLSFVVSAVIVLVVSLSGIRDAIAEYHAIKSEK